MDGCLSCKCGSKKLIPNVYMGSPTVISIMCIDCNAEGKKHETLVKAVLAWNSRGMSGYEV